ncbi:MAG: alginate lyase family protein [Anaerolineales bacterium]|nr:alginate lyase family protein [Anaerolineales bacterium]
MTQTLLFLFYQVGKKTGLWRMLTPARAFASYRGELHTRESIPVSAGGHAAEAPLPPSLLARAEEIVHGQVPLFGTELVPLHFSPPHPLHHWTHHETAQIHGQDIKFIWEPARFGWVFHLAHAYTLTNDARHDARRYPAAFWKYFEQFCAANPPNLGPHWSSAQEVGLRLIAFTYAHRAFADSPESTPARLAALGRAVAAHAARIPPTLLYARAQNNNHLLSESAALYTAALVLPDHPHAPRWRTLGWKGFHHGLQTQIEPDGTYSQHSTNYHRLMLQLALWVHDLAQHDPFVVGASAPEEGTEVPTTNPFPPLSQERLAAATRWLLALCDPETGRVPNLGPNDGAYIFPHPTLPFHDYRPVLEAAARAFLGDQYSVFSDQYSVFSKKLNTGYCLLNTDHSRAYLRAAHYRHRPGHADQLHLDLWWRGLNVARDPGTYLYNADPPWDNALMSAFVHNTVTVNGLDQMTRAGRFLYVHRAQAKILEHTPVRLVAEHDGYRALGLRHRRTVEPLPNGWRITDDLIKNSKLIIHNSPLISFRLHWLLPDWPWKLDGDTLAVQSPFGEVRVRVKIVNSEWSMINCQLFRAGETLVGEVPAHPTWGWFSPTYGVKEPALAFVLAGEGRVPVSLVSEWQFPAFS